MWISQRRVTYVAVHNIGILQMIIEYKMKGLEGVWPIVVNEMKQPLSLGGGGEIGKFMKKKTQNQLCWLTIHKGL